MTENSPQVDESHEEAAMTLFNPSTIMLHAVSHGISPHNVRTRLLNHVAGVDPPPRPKSPVDPFQSSSSPSAPSSSNSQSNTDRTSTTTSVMNNLAAFQPLSATQQIVAGAAAQANANAIASFNASSVARQGTPDPIVAYVRVPKHRRRRKHQKLT